MAGDILNHDDGVVDQNADRENQGEQADAIDGVAHQIGGKQRQQDRGGDHDQRNQRLAPARVEACAHPDGPAPRRRNRDIDRFDGRRCSVINRCIGNWEPGQAGYKGLVLEQGLEHPLSHLGLIGRIGRDELGAAPERPRHRRHVVVVSAPTRETDELTGGPVPPCQPGHFGRHVGFGHPRGQVEAASQPECLGYALKEVGWAREPQITQHPGEIVIGVRDEVSHQFVVPDFFTKGRRAM